MVTSSLGLKVFRGEVKFCQTQQKMFVSANVSLQDIYLQLVFLCHLNITYALTGKTGKEF